MIHLGEGRLPAPACSCLLLCGLGGGVVLGRLRPWAVSQPLLERDRPICRGTKGRKQGGGPWRPWAESWRLVLAVLDRGDWGMPCSWRRAVAAGVSRVRGGGGVGKVTAPRGGPAEAVRD